jgi:hypothetical protein
VRVGLGGKLKKPDIDAKHQTGQQSVLPPGLASWSGEHGTHRRWQRETGQKCKRKSFAFASIFKENAAE